MTWGEEEPEADQQEGKELLVKKLLLLDVIQKEEVLVWQSLKINCRTLFCAIGQQVVLFRVRGLTKETNLKFWLSLRSLLSMFCFSATL